MALPPEQYSPTQRATAPGLDAPEGIVFGMGSHLPDASVLTEVAQDWDNHHISRASSNIVELPSRPEYVIRYVGQDLRHGNTEQWINDGIRHLHLLESSGIMVPPHRYVHGAPLYCDPQIQADLPRVVYAFTDRLQGRNLTVNPRDATHTVDVIIGQAKYLQAVANTKEPEFMRDIMSPRQFTVTTLGNVMLHDTGFNEFAPTYSHDRSPYLSWEFKRSVDTLQNWASGAGVPTPDALIEVQQLVKANEV